MHLACHTTYVIAPDHSQKLGKFYVSKRIRLRERPVTRKEADVVPTSDPSILDMTLNSEHFN